MIANTNKTHEAQKNNLANHNLLRKYCKNIDGWADSWKGDECDVAIGLSIVEAFKLFLLSRIEKGRAIRTIKKDAGYLWALGGELIRQINYNEDERKLCAKDLILKYISEDGGPYWRHAFDELEHDRYDSVCRQLFKFMIASA